MLKIKYMIWYLVTSKNFYHYSILIDVNKYFYSFWRSEIRVYLLNANKHNFVNIQIIYIIEYFPIYSQFVFVNNKFIAILSLWE